MKRRALAGGISLCAALSAWIGCGSDAMNTTQSGTTSESGAGSTGGSGGDGSGGGVENPIFEVDIVPIINKSCGAKDGACHARIAYAADSSMNCRGWLSLEDAPLGATLYGGSDEGKLTGCPDLPLYDRLVGLDAWECGSDLRRYIKPCSPDKSFLINKIDGGPACGADPNAKLTKMPPIDPIDPSDAATIRTWIKIGAPRMNGDKANCDATQP